MPDCAGPYALLSSRVLVNALHPAEELPLVQAHSSASWELQLPSYLLVSSHPDVLL